MVFAYLGYTQWGLGPYKYTYFNELADEIADVQIYLLRMCSMLEIDPVENSRRKLSLNKEKYPIDEFSGSSRKYDS